MLKKLLGAHSLRAHLIAFGCITVLPVTILAGVLLVRSAMFDRTQLEARLLQVASDLADDIDREVDRNFTVLRTLATLPSLRSADWPTFYDQARAAVGDRAYVILLDSSLRQLVNTYLPYSEAPPITGDMETGKRILESKQPEVSDVFVSLATKQPVYNVNIPIIVDGEVRYILLLGHLADDLLPIVLADRVGPEWVTAIIDRKGAVIARSVGHARLVGTSPPQYAADLDVRDRKLSRMTSVEGEEVLRAVARCRTSGWLATVNVPFAMSEEPLRRSLWLWGSMAVFALILTLVLSSLFGRALARPMAIAADAAAALGREEAVPPLNSSLIEANSIVAALARARDDLAQRTKEQQLLANELSHRVKNVLAVVQTLMRQTLSGQRTLSEARTVFSERIQALSRAQDQLFRTDWKGIPIKDIIDAELAPYIDRIALNGPKLTVDGKMVQTFHLVLHELATNAVKYGSLSDQKGTVSITWSVAGSTPDTKLKFRWEEKGGPVVQPPAHAGFGKMLLTSAFLGAGVAPRFEYSAGGLVYEFEVPINTNA